MGQGGYCCVDQRGAALLVEFGGDDLARRRNCDIDSNGANLGKCLGFLLRDALLRQAAASLQCLLEIARCLRGDALRFGLGVSDNRLGLGRGFALLLLVSGKRLLGLVTKSPRGFKFVSDPAARESSPPRIAAAPASTRR